jgi:S1-C subfamily serine protease
LLWAAPVLAALLLTPQSSASTVADSAPTAAAAEPAPRPVVRRPTANLTSSNDDVAPTERSVVRVVTVASVNGEVVGFGHGSGFAITPTRIITNAHVVSDAEEYPDNVIIGIVPSEGSRSYQGRLVRIDRTRDLAIIEMVEGHIPAASLYTGPVAQRQNVFALGYPGNVDVATAQSMDDFIRPRSPVASDGIISATDTVNGVAALVHDADIARGNSGGPLVDACGRVVGVNTFISRADEGDSPFSFAVTVQEVARFLRDAGQSFTAVSGACVTAAEASARDAAMSEQERRAAADAAALTAAQQSAAAETELAARRGAAQKSRENFMAIAIALFGGAVLAGSAAMMFTVQAKPRERLFATVGAVVLALGALILFLMRPNPGAVTLPESFGAAAPDGAAVANAGGQTPRIGRLLCQVDRSRGRITVSAGQDVEMDFAANGCVNGRTQYVQGRDGLWSRTLVPNQDATISRMTYNPVTGDYVMRRYLMPLSTMERARALRGTAAAQGCSANTAQRAGLLAREDAIRALLPTNANEELVHRCAVTASR